jgi:osmoprotectant transport system permease protein
VTTPAGPAAQHPSLPSSIGIRNQVLLVLVVIAAVAALTSGFVVLAPNRLVSGRPIALWTAVSAGSTVSFAVLGALLLAASLSPPARMLHAGVALLAGLLLLLTLAAAGQAAHTLAVGAGPAARISLGGAVWLIAGCAALATVDALQRLGAGPAGRVLAVVAIGGGMAALATAGTFDALSIVREYASRRQLFAEALLRHMALVAGSVGPALAIGFPLGVAAFRAPRVQGLLFAVLNMLQTIPSIALFGLLIAPLSALAMAVPRLAALGIGGIGPAPAVIALVLYALLPIVRNTAAGLAGVDRAVIDAARGMGLTGRQVFWRIELPLASPVLLAGLRIVVVQTIGLAVVAALIGAGGLGTFVFEGLGQYALDLVLLGALPAIFLALAADFVLQTLLAVLSRRALL